VATTSDIYPTLLDLLGIEVPGQPVLDGVSLRGVIEGTTEERGSPVGFWSFVARGIRTPSREWMPILLVAQDRDRERDIPPHHLLMDAARVEGGYGEEDLTGHSAWLDGDWKLHRIADPDGAPRFELYRLSEDPAEATDLAPRQPDRVRSMGVALDTWMRSVVDSLNGADY
jgi:arylsulfatase A-like enzyme